MELKKLHKDLISKLRSTFTINTFTQCIMELVYNSLDANSTAVAIRLNLVTYRIQVVDNGDGISKDNMLRLGIRYMTSKSRGLQDFEKQVKYYGYRGEALASIIECSKSVHVTSRHKNTPETYSKKFQKNGNEQLSLIQPRPSSGTTVTVEGVFYNLAVRRNRIVPELELDDLKTFIQNIIMMHPNVSFTIRDDVSSELLLNSHKHKDIIAALNYFHPEIDCDFSLLKVSKNKFTVEALLFKDLHDNKSVQYIFVNKRPIHSAKIQKYIANTISKNRKNVRKRIENLNNMYPMYIVNIKCPYAVVSYKTDQLRTTVEFADWSLVFRYIERLVYSFFGNEEKLRQQKKTLPPPPPDDFTFDCGPSQIYGAVKAYGYKRGNKEINCEGITEKVPKLQDGYEFESTNVNNLLRSKTAESITEKFPELLIEPSVSGNNDNIDKQNVKKDTLKDSETNEMCAKYLGVDEVYCISDTSPQKKSKIPFKKPLPIKITGTNKQQASCLYTNMKISPKQQEVVKYPQNILHRKSVDEQSAVTAFTNDEVKGKNLIMDMFLKSTQVFNCDESTSDVRSEGTIFEVESNMLLENNVMSNVNGYKKTMSISVNVKTKQKLKRRKKPRSKVSKCVQTTFRSKSVKSVKLKKVKQVENKAFESVCSNERLGEYTIIFSNTMKPDQEPKFKFIPHNSGTECGAVNANDLEQLCFCGCHSGKEKLFSFNNEERQLNAIRDDENTDVPSKPNYGKNKQHVKTSDPKYDLEGECDAQHNTKHDNVSHLKKFRNVRQYDEIDNAKHEQSYPHKYNQHQFIADSLENHFDDDLRERQVDIGLNKMVTIENRDVEQENRNIQQMYAHQSIGQKQYDKNFVYHIEKSCSTKQALQTKDYCHYTNEYKPKYVNNFHSLEQLQNYTNEDVEPKNTNFEQRRIVRHASYIRSNEENGHSNSLRQNFQKPIPRLSCQDIYALTTNDHQSSKYPKNTCQNSPIPNWVECEITKNPNLYCHQALPTQSPYFKRPAVIEPNMFRFVGPKITHLRKKLNTGISESPYFLKHDRMLYVDTDIDNQQELEKLENQKIQTLPVIEEQNVFHCGSEQTLSKMFDTQLFTQRSYDRGKSEDLIGSGDINFTINSFKQFRPEYLSTQLEEVAELTDSNVKRLNVEAIPFQDAQQYAIKRSTHDATKLFPTGSSELCITLSNNQKQSLLNEEMKQDKVFDLYKFEEWNSQPTKTNQVNFFADGWIKQTDKCGNFYYVNKQTGYATYNTPNHEGKNCFKMKERYEFVPKGFSPMLVETEPVDQSLSQNKKDKLLEYIMEAYQTDLMYIKWRNYINDIDPDVFFDNLYKEKVKQYEESIPNVAILQPRDKIRKDQISFDKKMFLNIRVIGQIDKKFISALEPKQNLLILFDQHAVHERIRLEKLLTDYKHSKCKCEEIVVFLPKSNLKLLVKHEKYINSLGFTATHYTDSINITEIPSFVYHKFKDSETGSLAKVIQLLIKEIVELLRSTRGSTTTSLPKFLQDIISLEACRGAIKFGDILNKEQCADLLKSLSSCNLPFQCAHGRPTLVPLMHLGITKNIYAGEKIHFKNILSCEL